MPWTQFATGGGGGGQARNPRRTYETISFGVDTIGAGRNVQNGTGSNSKTPNFVQLGPTVSAWCALVLTLQVSANTRYLIDLSTDGVNANLVANLLFTASSAGTYEILLPIRVPAATTLFAKVQATSASQTVNIAIVGTVANAFDPPGFSSMVNIVGPEVINTRGSTTLNITSAGGTPGAWAVIADPTTAAYGAIMFVPTEGATQPATGGSVIFDIGVAAAGAAGSEAVLYSHRVNVSASAPSCTRAGSPPIMAAIPAASRLSVRVRDPNNAGYAYRGAVYGFIE